MKNISTHFLQVSTVLGAFALAVAFMFGVQSTPEVNAATCTVDVSANGTTADVTCRVDVGGTLTVTVKTDEIEKLQVFNDDATSDPTANGADVLDGLVIESDTTATHAGANGPTKQTALAASGTYSTTFSVAAGVTPGRAVMGIDEFGTTAQKFTAGNSSANRANHFFIDVLGKPVDSVDTTDDDGDGVADVCAGGAGTCSVVTPGAISTTLGTSAVVVDIKDTNGVRLGGLTTLTATGYTWDQSGTDTLVFNASTTGTDTYTLKGLPTGTANVKSTITAAYAGTSGSRTITAYATRSDSVVSTVTAVLYKDSTEASTALAADAAVAAGAELMPQDTNAVDTDGAKNDEYYVDVNAMDSAGNMVTGKVFTWTDDDGLTSKGLGVAGAGGITTVVYAGTSVGQTHVTTDTDDGNGGDSATDGDIKVGIGHLASGIYNITFKESVSKSSATLTLNVRGAGKVFALTGPANILPGEIGIYSVTATDANGFATSGATAATFIVTGLGTGAGAGSKVPTDGNVSISSSTGANITVVAPTTGGSGTVALIHGGKVQQSVAVSYGAAVATVSGAGCTGAATGNYTCVVTGGGTAAEVATAAGAVSIWQSDSLGVLQGYVVGTPDFVNTGLASTAAIASDSAIIVVR